MDGRQAKFFAVANALSGEFVSLEIEGRQPRDHLVEAERAGQRCAQALARPDRDESRVEQADIDCLGIGSEHLRAGQDRDPEQQDHGTIGCISSAA